MAAVLRRGLYGGARSPYGDFGLKPEHIKGAVKVFTRRGLYCGARSRQGVYADADFQRVTERHLMML